MPNEIPSEISAGRLLRWGRRCGPNAIPIMLFLLLKAKDGDWVHLSVKEVNKRTGVGQRAQEKCIDELLKAGIIEIKANEYPRKRIARIILNGGQK